MSHYILTMNYHHNNPAPDLYWNIQAKTENEALLEGYKTLIQQLTHDDAIIPDLTPILTQKEMVVTVYEDEELDEENKSVIVIWNLLDCNDEPSRGAGYGTNSSNIWFKHEKRKNTKESLSKVIKGYRQHFNKLSKDVLVEVVRQLDNI